MKTENSRSVIVAYGGVHQAFQIALAAEEAGLLETFYGSLFDAPGKWGKWFGLMMRSETLINRRTPGIASNRLEEIPTPFLLNRFAGITGRTRGWYPWYKANFAFDRKAAARLQYSRARLFVGTETCTRDSFRAAGKNKMIKVLDCPQAHPVFLTRLFKEAADHLKVPPPPPFDPPELAARKAEEFAMADIFLVISEMQRRSFIEAGFPAKCLVAIPLWVDSQLWFPPADKQPSSSSSPLKILFVGNIGLRKGIPYLTQAVEKCGDRVQLTLVGINSGETNDFISRNKSLIRYAGTKNKTELREIYGQSDILVLPSLVDTFGFAALEAMACGLPVIVTENCGVPVPEPAWRVPIMNSDAIAQRLEYYVANREALQFDGAIARQFSKQFTPERYREQIKNLLRELLKN